MIQGVMRIKKWLLFACISFSFFTQAFCQSNSPKLNIYHLTDSFYVYTTYGIVNGEPFPSNSMYLVTGKGVVMFDTPWDTTQFQPLMDSIEKRHHQPVVLCVATHFHTDKTAGLEFLRSKGVTTYSSKQTYDLCKERHEKQAQYFFLHDTTFTVGNYTFQTYYAGPGHSPDNIVIWFEPFKILYGGCLVKSTENNSIGNLSDADVAEWPKTIRKVINKFPSPKYVIPGHFSWANNQSLQHTLQLLNKTDKGK